MIDHTGVVVRDLARSKAFYAAALAPVGIGVLAEFPAALTGSTDVVGLGELSKPEESAGAEFWLSPGEPSLPMTHIAFRAATRAAVDQFYAAALAAGGRDNGKPGVRAHYHKHYYAAFVFDPDGHNVEVVCHKRDQR